MLIIKIIFVILLLIPVAILMRSLIRRLSSETPKQTYTDDERTYEIEKKQKESRRTAPTGRKSGKDKKSKTDKDKKRDRSKRGKTVDNKAAESVNDAGSFGYTPRRPEEWHRSDRVPFGESEGYRVDPPKGKSHGSKKSDGNDQARQWRKPSDALRERAQLEASKADADTAGINDTGTSTERRDNRKRKTKNRSEKSPSKRQLRKNRERARKRDLKKRKQEAKIERRSR